MFLATLHSFSLELEKCMHFLNRRSEVRQIMEIVATGLCIYWSLIEVILMSLRYNSGHPRWLSGKKSACKAGDTGHAGSVSESGRYPGERNGNQLQYFSVGNPTDRGVWQATSMGLQWVRHGWAHMQVGVILRAPYKSSLPGKYFKLKKQVFPLFKALYH